MKRVLNRVPNRRIVGEMIGCQIDNQNRGDDRVPNRRIVGEMIGCQIGEIIGCQIDNQNRGDYWGRCYGEKNVKSFLYLFVNNF